MPSRLLVPILSPSRVLLCGVAAGGEGCHARGVAASPRLLPRDRQRLQIPLSVTTAMLRRVHEQVCPVGAVRSCRSGYQRASTRLVVGFAQSSAPSTQRHPPGYQRGSARLVVGFTQPSAPSTPRNWRSAKDTRTI